MGQPDMRTTEPQPIHGKQVFYNSETGLEYLPTVQRLNISLRIIKTVVEIKMKRCLKQSLIDTLNKISDSICGTHSSKFSLLHQGDQNIWLVEDLICNFSLSSG